MIEELYVKNFALIREANINFKNNLNVLTGETGSGKSILIGSIDLALGKRANRDVILNEKDSTEVCITFSEDNKEIIKKLKDIDVELDQGNLIIYRKITKDKNISKINDVPCTLNKIKEVTELLVDIYGQHDSEDLRKNSKHIEFLDDFIGEEAKKIKLQIKSAYDKVKELKDRLLMFDMDEDRKKREIDLLEYEVKEIEEINIKDGEEEELALELKELSNANKILENLNTAKDILEDCNVGKALKEIKEVEKYNPNISKVASSIEDVDSILIDAVKDIDSITSKLDIDEKTLNQIENRLDKIRSVLSKYKNDTEIMKKELINKKERLQLLTNYDIEKEKLEDDIKKESDVLNDICKTLSDLRKQKSKEFEEKLIEELKDLGFFDVNFQVKIEKDENIKIDGYDDVTFMISLNVGEKIRSLSEVASGGELSRIMLSIKTIMSKEEGTNTLIFDEIDQGISGITASKVAKKLNKISKNHQVLCISHLPQIAAMADNHFRISKSINSGETLTNIESLDKDGMIYEIARLIGNSDTPTEKVLANAQELKENANKEKME